MARGKRKSGAGGTPVSKGAAHASTSNEPPPPPEPNEEDGAPPPEEAYYSDEEGGTRIGDIYIPPPIKPHCSTESKGPRLIIKKIENENFKSYAGKVVLGPFHHRFSAIIGPNGSGKSNVIDSMLFVFGYRAQKIRCKKLSVLLHNSAKYPDVGMCTVIVHFKQIVDLPDGEYEEIEGSEIAIGRTAFRDNSSYYTLNGRRVQFKEVSKLLKHHGVDLDHNRFLILQGEVESISLMKPKSPDGNECGMLEYLEDIIGTNRYKEPLAKINDRVEKLTEERTEKHNRCKLAEREMKDLEQPYNEAVEYLKLENALTRTKNLQIQKYLSEQNKKLEEFGVEKEEIVKELHEHDQQYDGLKKEREEKEAIIKDEIAKFDKLCKDKEEMEKNLKFHLNSYTEAQSTMVTVNNRRKQNKKQLQTNEDKLVELKKIPEKNKAEIAECEKKIEQLTKKKTEQEEKLQQNYASIEEQTKPLIEEREKLETQLADLKKNSDEAKAELSLAESELKMLRSDETTEKRKYESLKTSYEESRSNLDVKRTALEECQKMIPDLHSEISAKTKELQNYRNEERSLSDKIFTIRAEISEKMSSMKVAKSNNKVLDSLMRQKMEGKLPGIFGRLGDLGGIDAKYDVAISTACRRLDNIVVDTVNTAQACIEFLRRNNIGRASIIALEKIQHLRSQCEQRIKTPENVPRLFDLVRVEDRRVLPAFFFALRNTLVANDLDQGTRVAYGASRFRVVTLRGDLIEISGTMSGGGKTQLRGKMGTQVSTKSANTSVVSQKDLEDMQIQAQEMQSRINYCQQEQGRLEREIRELQMALNKNESEVKKLTVTLNSLSEQLPRIEAQLQTQKLRAEKTIADPAKVKQLEKIIEERRKVFEESDKATTKLANKIKDLKKKIEEVHGQKIKSVQDSIDKTGKEMNKLSSHISKLKVEITTSERNCKKVEKEIEDLKNEVLKAEETVKKLAEERGEHDQDALDLTTKIEAAKEEIENANKQSSSIQKEIMAIQKKESDGRLKRVTIEEKLEALNKKISDVKSQLPHWKNKLKPLKLQEIPGETEEQEPLKTYTEEELNTYKLQDLQYQYSVQEEKLNSKKPNLSVIQEYMNKRETYLERVKILEDITNTRNEMRQLYDDVRKKRYTEFMQGFHIITKKLKEMYQMITQGGDAELELVDSMDPFTEGVSFSVRPPKKSWKNISNLSGGEKTLSSLALVFALHYYKPSPLYFMDEIDAALDFKNISIVAHYIKERTKNAQFIIISLRSNMFELSDNLVGIYKVQDCTNSVTIKNQAPKSMPTTESQCFGLSQQPQSTQQSISLTQQSIVSTQREEMQVETTATEISTCS